MASSRLVPIFSILLALSSMSMNAQKIYSSGCPSSKIILLPIAALPITWRDYNWWGAEPHTWKSSGFNMVKGHTPQTAWSHRAVLQHRVKVKDTGLFETENFTGIRLPSQRDLLYCWFQSPTHYHRKVQRVTSSSFLQIVSTAMGFQQATKVLSIISTSRAQWPALLKRLLVFTSGLYLSFLFSSNFCPWRWGAWLCQVHPHLSATKMIAVHALQHVQFHIASVLNSHPTSRLSISNIH